MSFYDLPALALEIYAKGDIVVPKRQIIFVKTLITGCDLLGGDYQLILFLIASNRKPFVFEIVLRLYRVVARGVNGNPIRKMVCNRNNVLRRIGFSLRK